MPRFIVRVQEIHVQEVAIEADSPEDAKERVLNGEGDYADGTEHLESLSSEEWSTPKEIDEEGAAYFLSRTHGGG
jgi:hypothetical protein